MAGYRDDRDALRLENERLEADLGEAERALAEQNARASEAENALATQQAELAAKEAELAALRPIAAAPVAGGKVRCPACARENDSRHRFCLGCGGVLTGAALVPTPAPGGAQELAEVPAQSNSTAVIAIAIAMLLVSVGAGLFFLLAAR